MNHIFLYNPLEHETNSQILYFTSFNGGPTIGSTAKFGSKGTGKVLIFYELVLFTVMENVMQLEFIARLRQEMDHCIHTFCGVAFSYHLKFTLRTMRSRIQTRVMISNLTILIFVC